MDPKSIRTQSAPSQYSQDGRKPYIPPAILISLPLEASAGQSQIGGRPGSEGGSSDGWDDEW